MTPTAPTEILVSLADIARLARVQRPVVSTWRKRPMARGEMIPFPAPITTRDSQEFFDLVAVLEWLERTGRGNNPDARTEAALVSGGPAPGDDADAAALEALLSISRRADRSLGGLSAEEILDLADELDPDDAFAYREIDGVSSDLPRLAAHAEALSEAAFGPGAAMATLTARTDALDPRVARLVASLAASLLAVRSFPAVSLAGPRSGVTLARDVLDLLPEGSPSDVVIRGTSDDASARQIRRLAAVRELTFAETTRRSLVTVADVGARPSSSAGAALSAAEEVQLDLGPDDTAIVLGPASALVDALDSADHDKVRSDVLRSGRLRCVVRMPQGLVPGSPRAVLALWVLGPDRGLPPIAERWVATVDLSDRDLSDGVVAGLKSDVAAILAEPRLGAAHAFVLARLERVADLLARRGALVARGATPRRLSAPGAEVVVEARRFTESLVAEAPVPLVSPGAIQTRRPAAPVVTIDQLLTVGALSLVPGARLDATTSTGGSIRLLRLDDLLIAPGEQASGHGTIGTLDLELTAPRARRTEPGDVVFCTAPRPTAAVDREGRSVVCSPARILRPTPGSGVCPEALAAAINAQPPTARQWRSWRVVRLDASEAASLSRALRDLEDERTRLRRRLHFLNQLTSHLTSGAATVSADTSPDQHPTEGP